MQLQASGLQWFKILKRTRDIFKNAYAWIVNIFIAAAIGLDKLLCIADIYFASTQLLLYLAKLTLIFNIHCLTSLSSWDDSVFGRMLTLLTPSLPKHTQSLDRSANPQHIDCFLIRSTQLGFLPQNVTGLPWPQLTFLFKTPKIP